MKTIYIVRHCQAEGQEAEAPLTADGLVQADRLADLLMDSHVERIISSPYVRAKDSVAPLAGRLKLPVELDERLVERVLCAGFMNDWQQHLEASFRDLDLCLEGGESSRAANQAARRCAELFPSWMKSKSTRLKPLCWRRTAT